VAVHWGGVSGSVFSGLAAAQSPLAIYPGFGVELMSVKHCSFELGYGSFMTADEQQ
jgi:hypothetical protein